MSRRNAQACSVCGCFRPVVQQPQVLETFDLLFAVFYNFTNKCDATFIAPYDDCGYEIESQGICNEWNKG